MAKKREDSLMEKCRCGNIEEQGSSAKPREALKWFSSSANAVKTSHMWQILYFEQSYELIFFVQDLNPNYEQIPENIQKCPKMMKYLKIVNKIET